MGDEAFVIFSEVGLGVWKSPVIEWHESPVQRDAA